jgi:hypothetical protein
VGHETTNGLYLEKTESDRTSDTPFTVEELTRALTAAKFEEKE